MNARPLKSFLVNLFFISTFCVLADSNSLLLDFLKENEAVKAQNFGEVINTAESPLATRLDEFKKAARVFSTSASLPETKKIPGVLLRNNAERYGNAEFPMGTALGVTAAINGMVYPFNGELINSDQDLQMPLRSGIGFSFSRLYSSFNKSDLGLGVGWRHSYDVFLTGIKQNEALISICLHLNSHDVVFNLVNGEWQVQHGDFYELKINQDNTIYIFDATLTRYAFEPSSEKTGSPQWRLKQIASRHRNWTANELNFYYLANSDKIDYAIDPFGNRADFYYDSLGHIIAVSTPTSYVRFSYSTDGNLLQASFPLRKGLSGNSEQGISYEYASGNWLIGKKSHGLPFHLFVEYNSEYKVQKIGTKDLQFEIEWFFNYYNGKTEVVQPFPLPHTTYFFNSPVHSSLPSRIERLATDSIESIEYNEDGLEIKHISPIGEIVINEYDSGNPRVLFRQNLLKTHTLPAKGYYTDWLEVGRETKYHSSVSLPVLIRDYQIDLEGKKSYVKQESMEYTGDDFVLKTHNDLGRITRYWFNPYGEVAVMIGANGTANVFSYSDSCIFPEYDFMDGKWNGKGFLAHKLLTNDSSKIKTIIKEISGEIIELPHPVSPIVEQEEFLSYDCFGNVIRHKIGLSDDLVLYNLYSDSLARFSLDKGCQLTIFTPWGKPSRILHEFAPSSGLSKYKGNSNPVFSGCFYVESFEYEGPGWLHKHYQTDEPTDSGMVRRPYIYERYPSGKVKSISSPEGITRLDVRDENTGLLREQKLYSSDGNSSVVLASDFEYYPDGLLKSMTDRFGGKCMFLLNGFGENYAEVMPNGVITQIKTNSLGQELSKWSYKDDITLARTDKYYNEQNLLTEIRVFEIYKGLTKEISAEQYKYDIVGNVIAKRSAREGAWSYYLYDGLNREIASITPSGDMSMTFYGKYVPYFSLLLQKDSCTGKQHRIGNFSEFDYLGRKIKTCPVTSDWRKVLERGTELTYNVIGQKTKSASFDQVSETWAYDSLGNIIVERKSPLKREFDEEDVIIRYYYNDSGKILRKELENDALALIKNEHGISPAKKKAPQITRYSYDSLARLVATIQPDGLVQEYIYNEHSLPQRMRWYYEPTPDTVLRDLEFSYSEQAQVLSISDVASGETVRTNDYDLLGNCVRNVDIDTQGRKIVIEREFDSTGAKRSETTKVGDLVFPTQLFDYDLKLGIASKSWNGLHRTSLRFWDFEQYSLDLEGRLIAITGVDKPGIRFASWDYLGKTASRRIVQNSCITTITDYNDFLEPIVQRFKNHVTGLQIGKLEYRYGPQGQSEFTSSQLLCENTQKDYLFASYSKFDSYRRLCAQSIERNIPSDDGWKKRSAQLFAAPSSSNLSAMQTQRMAYDQANNIWLNYTGGYFMPANLRDYGCKQNPVFVSSAEPLYLANGKIQELDLLNLASNRDVSRATYEADGETIKAETQIYNKLGCLIEYDGTYYNGIERIRAKWKLEYDSLGRLVTMHAYAIDENVNRGIKKNNHLAELLFSYDSENRRILKTVIDTTPGRTIPSKTTYTIYTGTNQSIVFELKDGKLVPREQYLWKPGTRELIMAAMPTGYAQGGQKASIERYYFQQDKSLNVVFTSKQENGQMRTVSALSYFGFGENATQADIINIRSSLNGVNIAHSFNQSLEDADLPAQWYNLPRMPQYLELELAGSDKLSALKIWTAANFPETFGVYVLPKDVPSPTTGDMNWAMRHIDCLVNFVQNRKYGNDNKSLDWETPYNIPLCEKEGNRIVVFWESSNISRVDVREFEVIKAPNNPTAIAFAGQWLDVETNLYYQINRYRLAGSNKFISPDPLGYFDGNNLYAYAHNNPLEWHDPDGRWAHIVAGAGIGAVLGGGMYALNCWLSGEEFNWAEFAVSIVAGAASGAIAAALLPVNPILAGAVAGAVGGAIMEGGITFIRTGDWKASLLAAGQGAVWGAAAGAFASGLGMFSGSSNWCAGLVRSVASGATTGGLFGGLRRATDVFMATGDWAAAFAAGRHASFKGAVMGGFAGAAGYSLARATNSLTSKHNSSGGKNSDSTYNRPSNFRKGIRDQVWEANREASTGQVRDPLTGRFMSKNSPWDMGHKPGYEWWKFKDYARTNNLSRQEVLDWNNNPDHFRPELPSSNRCHLAEDMTSSFFGGSAPYEAGSGSGLLDVFSGDFSFGY